jgi:hypothetical protein
VPLPPFTASGDLPPSVHRATLLETLERFGRGAPQRMQVGLRLERIYNVARATGHLARCVVLGSFVTAKPAPNQVDVFLRKYAAELGMTTEEKKLELCPRMGYPEAFRRPEQALKP